MLRPALTEPQEATRDARSTTQTQSRMRHADKHIHTSRMIVLSSARALRNAAQSILCCRFAAAASANRTHFCVRAARRNAAARRHHKNNRVARLAEVEQQAVATQRHDLRAVGRASLEVREPLRKECVPSVVRRVEGMDATRRIGSKRSPPGSHAWCAATWRRRGTRRDEERRLGALNEWDIIRLGR